MRVLGIETSCDETAAAVVEDGRRSLGSVVASQTDLHARFGGVVPEIACRAHAERISAVIEEALARAGVSLTRLDAIAVTTRPGLVGALLVGISAAKGLSLATGLPLVPVNHLEAHVAAALLLPEPPGTPFVSLVASGGHTVLYRSDGPTRHERLGATTDDAAGEAFDKAAAILGLGYPGGPAIEKAASGGDPRAARLPRALLGRDSLDFSFSGLKTALLYTARGSSRGPSLGKERPGPLPPGRVADLAASFQEAVVDVLVEKALRAARHAGASRVVIGGGVACNGRLRTRLAEACAEEGLDLSVPPPRLCTDNADMVAALGCHLFGEGARAGLDLDADPNPVRSRGAHGARGARA